jgi:hypothetical protein
MSKLNYSRKILFSKLSFKLNFLTGRRIQCSFRKYNVDISAMQIKPQNSKSSCQKKYYFLE